MSSGLAMYCFDATVLGYLVVLGSLMGYTRYSASV